MLNYECIKCIKIMIIKMRKITKLIECFKRFTSYSINRENYPINHRIMIY